jgi:hypothetical protein
MRRHTSTVITAGLAAVLGVLTVPHAAPAQQSPFQPDIPVPPYNPYPPLPGSTPPTVLPPDLQPEIYRVRREVQTIFGRYFAEWHALTSMPTNTSNPPTLFPNGYDAVRISWRAVELRRNDVALQQRGLRFLPYAICRV